MAARAVPPSGPGSTEDLCPPDGLPEFASSHSPKATAFAVPLFIPPKAEPVSETKLIPPVDEPAHQKYPYFKPKKFYVQYEQEIQWQYHTDCTLCECVTARPPSGVVRGGGRE